MRLPNVLPIVLGLALVLAPGAGASGASAQAPGPRTLRMEFHADGAVTLQAQNVTPREIFMEWARQCGCFVVNADRLPGGPLSYPLVFTHESQAKVIESLLRSAAGYLLTPRRAGNTSASAYETIYILPTTTASASTASSFNQPYVPPAPPTTPGSPDDEIPPVTPVPGAGGATNAPRPDPNAARPAPSAGSGIPSRFVPVPIVPVGSAPPGAPTAAPGQTTPAPAQPATVRPAN